MVYTFETFRDVKGIVILPFLNVTHLYYLSFQIDFMRHQRWKMGCVKYARFPKSGHIFQRLNFQGNKKFIALRNGLLCNSKYWQEYKLLMLGYNNNSYDSVAPHTDSICIAFSEFDFIWQRIYQWYTSCDRGQRVHYEGWGIHT